MGKRVRTVIRKPDRKGERMKRIVLKCGRLFCGVDETVQENMAVTVEDNRIVGVAPWKDGCASRNGRFPYGLSDHIGCKYAKSHTGIQDKKVIIYSYILHDRKSP